VLNRLWCAALGVASVADDDDFFALGGESMTVLDLLGRVREQTRLAISVTEFSRDATFGALVGLAEREQAPGTRPAVRVVTLAEGGTGRPLFLAADAAGNALSYQALVGALDVSRPVYGLEPAEGPRAPMTIQDNAAHHVAAVLRTQRSGPYTVGGWSFGAVLAHEMARQLTERGERVDLLLCLDAVPLGRRKLPLGLDPGFWAGAVWLRACSVLGIGAVGRRARRDPGLRDLLMAKARDLARYRPGPVGCPAVVFKAGIGAGAAARLQDRLCAQYGGGARVFPAGGDHWTMLAAPHVQELAAALRGLLPDGQED
jgi:phthiocerol/phenolphthiocerol synthesis type-I polyketide synthase E